MAGKSLVSIFLAFIVLLSACSSAKTDSIGQDNAEIQYEEQLLGTSRDIFYLLQAQEQEKINILLNCINNLDGTEKTLNYLDGYLDGIYGNLPAYYCLSCIIPAEVFEQILPSELLDAYAKATDAEVKFLEAVQENIRLSKFTDPSSNFRSSISELLQASEKIYALRGIITDWQRSKYCDDLKVYTDALESATLLLN